MFTTAFIDLDDVIGDVVLITWYGGLFGQNLCDVNMIFNVLSSQNGTAFFLGLHVFLLGHNNLSFYRKMFVLELVLT